MERNGQSPANPDYHFNRLSVINDHQTDRACKPIGYHAGKRRRAPLPHVTPLAEHRHEQHGH